MPHEVAVAVPDRERIAALLGVFDAAELAADMHLAVEDQLAAIDAHEAPVLFRVLARFDDERAGDADEGRLAPQQRMRALYGRDQRERRECADHEPGGEDAPVAARQQREIEHHDPTQHPGLPLVALDLEREVLRERLTLIGAQERLGPRARARADARLPAREVPPDPVGPSFDEAATRLAGVAHGWTI